MTESNVTTTAVIKWLGQARFKRLGDARLSVLRDVVKRAPDVATAAIWTLQECAIKPTPDDLARWEQETAPPAP